MRIGVTGYMEIQMNSSAELYIDGYGTVEGRRRSAGETFGEAVFTTAQTGYEESITDPSYAGQILIFAYPLIGNYGINPARFESEEPQVQGVVCREMTDEVASWLDDHNIPAIDHVDTRDLVLHLRDHGSSEATIADYRAGELESMTPDFDERKEMILKGTLRDSATVTRGPGPTIGLIDCGVKRGIIEEFEKRDVNLIIYPHDISVNNIEYDEPDLLFVSNGPGDPEWYKACKHSVATYAGKKPIAGICLGQQIIALALGGETGKMKFGHHGINQPVISEDTGRVSMTTQNHGYEVVDPGPLTVLEYNVNDNSAEALVSEEMHILTKQYHPEGRPGPQDSLDFFDKVVKLASLHSTSSHGLQ